ncbi:hypothetical protein CA607_02190 [Caulobacter vibrioides]|nr:hypothetical protein CA607_02190 [Caulobacter vibrioides]
MKPVKRAQNPPPGGGGVGSKRRRRGKGQAQQDFPLRPLRGHLPRWGEDFGPAPQVGAIGRAVVNLICSIAKLDETSVSGAVAIRRL